MKKKDFDDLKHSLIEVNDFQNGTIELKPIKRKRRIELFIAPITNMKNIQAARSINSRRKLGVMTVFYSCLEKR